MALAKQNQNINFSQGVDTKSDPKQIPHGKFELLKNGVLSKGGLLQKRNGYSPLPSISDSTPSFLTTFNGDLTALGSKIEAYSSGYGSWVDQGNIQPVSLSVLPLIRNNTNQSQVDTAIASNGLICTVYTDQNPASLSAAIFKYAVSDSVTGQNVVAPTTITGANAISGTPRVFILGSYFVIVYSNKVSSDYHIQYIAVSTTNPSSVTSATNITTSYTPASTSVVINPAFDGVVYNNSLYLAWNGASTSGIKMAQLSSTLSLSSTINPDASHTATTVSLGVDNTNGTIWVTYHSSSTTNGYTMALSPALAVILSATQTVSSTAISNLTVSATGGVATVIADVTHAYSYDSGIASNFIASNTITQAGVVGSTVFILRSVGLASKAFVVDGTNYILATYASPYQNTYFLVNADLSTSASPVIVAKLAYGNGGGYLSAGLPSVTVNGSQAQVAYLIKDLVQSVNKNTNVASGTQTAGIYSQTGINLASFTIGSDSTVTAEIGSNLNLTGGFLWSYDGYRPVEQNFFLYPDSVEVTATVTTGGNLAAQIYYYQFVYEWTDNQGNAFRSAPSLPVIKDLTGSGTATNKNTIQLPTLRLTYKTANPVKIVGYRWSTAQQSYYQFTSITSPTLNDTTIDSVTILDTFSDATILGNSLLYTTGGVVEDVNGPAAVSTFIFDDRLWLISAEDPNLLWHSKQVIEATPVEMSDLLTYYVAPNVGAQGSTGPLKCGFQMDDKAILFKASAINYFNGTGPDITGNNSQYSQPIFVTSTVGCSNQRSIVLQPDGLMFEFQSEVGNQIWLLGRDLSTRYIGAPMEALTQNATVLSAVTIPGTNQVLFTLDSGVTLMYDYYFNQWGSFTGIPSVSSTLYQGLHTYINSSGQVFQENPGSYVDGSRPVLMSFRTGWFNLAGLQGYQRAYFFYLLGTYISPHKLAMQIAYDYNSSATQSFVISPTNYSATFGTETPMGNSTAFGGESTVEQWRIFFQKQKCQAFQISLNEVFDSTLGTTPGAGLTLSGINLVFGIKKGYPRIASTNSTG